jgi:RNA polymerase sigma-70 factor, ECF subfamily
LHPIPYFLRIRQAEEYGFLKADQQEHLRATFERAGNGDTNAFAEIVRDRQAMVFSICWHYLQDRALAEDVAQEVFLELYQNLATLQSAEHLTYWLRRVTVNRCIDQGRRKKNRQELAMDDAAEPVAIANHTDPLLSRKLQQTLELLPEKQRMLVILRYQEGLDLSEIGELMKMPLNTVKSTLHRTLEDLRKKLTRKLGEIRYAIF